MMRRSRLLILSFVVLTQIAQGGWTSTRESRKYGSERNRVQLLDRKRDWKKTSRPNLFVFTSSQRSANFDWVCVGVSSGFRCGYCGMAVLCVGGKAYKQPCPRDTSCSLRPEFSGAVCHTVIPDGCKCRGANEILPDPYNPSSYIICTSSNRTPRRIEMCPEGYYFNVTTSTCQKVPHFPPCINFGSFPLESNCQWYYTCSIDSFGDWVQLPARCMTPNTVYSASMRGCAEPYSLPSSDRCSANAETPRSRYVCTLFGLIVTSIFPSVVDTFCHKISR